MKKSWLFVYRERLESVAGLLRTAERQRKKQKKEAKSAITRRRSTHAATGPRIHRLSDLQAARAFYDAIMTALGAVKVYDRPTAIGYGSRCNAHDTESTFLAIYLDPDERINPDDIKANRCHWCFKAPSHESVDAFFQAGLATGGRSDGTPGLRPHYHASYYAAFLFDPAGNRIEAVCHHAVSPQD